jgi:hypothetical protein
MACMRLTGIGCTGHRNLTRDIREGEETKGRRCGCERSVGVAWLVNGVGWWPKEVEGEGRVGWRREVVKGEEEIDLVGPGLTGDAEVVQELRSKKSRSPPHCLGVTRATPSLLPLASHAIPPLPCRR